jgi:hypothetical protein
MNQRRQFFTIQILLAATVASQTFAATSFFVPGGLANVEAGSDGTSPLSVGSFFEDHGADGHGTLQELYAASEFTGLGGPILISQIAFRNDEGDNPAAFQAALQNIQVYLDTTPQTIGGMSATFADNQHAPVLLYSGAITWNIPFDNANPRGFYYVIPFATPYIYDPSAGNLLVDIRIVLGNDPNLSSLPTLDYSRNSSVMAIAISYGSATDPTGLAGSNQGWPTQIGYTLATPEPSSAWLELTGVSLLGLAAFGRRRRARSAR